MRAARRHRGGARAGHAVLRRVVRAAPGAALGPGAEGGPRERRNARGRRSGSRAAAPGPSAELALHSPRPERSAGPPAPLIGSAGFYDWDGEVRSAEFGYDLRPEYWGRGLMAEALTAILDFAFGRLGLNRAQVLLMPRNRRSRRLVERLGFTEEGTLREHDFDERGELCDDVVFSLLAREWSERRTSSAGLTRSVFLAQQPRIAALLLPAVRVQPVVEPLELAEELAVLGVQSPRTSRLSADGAKAAGTGTRAGTSSSVSSPRQMRAHSATPRSCAWRGSGTCSTGPAEDVGVDLAPQLALRAAAEQAHLRDRPPDELLVGVEQPAGVEGDALEHRPHQHRAGRCAARG